MAHLEKNPHQLAKLLFREKKNVKQKRCVSTIINNLIFISFIWIWHLFDSFWLSMFSNNQSSHYLTHSIIIVISLNLSDHYLIINYLWLFELLNRDHFSLFCLFAIIWDYSWLLKFLITDNYQIMHTFNGYFMVILLPIIPIIYIENVKCLVLFWQII